MNSLRLGLLVGLSSILTSNVFAVVDQEFVPATTNEVSNVGASNTIDWAQTFTVGISGKLMGFDIWMDRQATTTLPLQFDIRKTTAGTPTEPDAGANILASGLIVATTFQTGGGGAFTTPATLPHIDLNSFSINVNAGDVLALVLQSDEPGPHLGLSYNWYGRTPSSGYANGRAFLRTFITGGMWQAQDQDQVFRTYVTPVPEPATILLCGITLVSVAALPWRRRSRE